MDNPGIGLSGDAIRTKQVTPGGSAKKPIAQTMGSFAQCITDSGTKFYGAFWCPHCQNQKAEFGKSAKYLPYVECSTPDGQSQKQECIDKEIASYPTWIYPDGSRVTGEISLATLAQKTDCALPEN